VADAIGHISSAVVTARPEDTQSVAAEIAKRPGTEVHAIAGHRIVVVMEGANAAVLADRLNAIAALPLVLAASMVFEQALDQDEMDAA
jgi:periplasmic nitrate reductase NapD